MGASQREFRNRIKSTSALKKIFSAQELIATSRIAKARQAVTASNPFSRAITQAVSAVATLSNAEHPLTTEREVKRAAVLLLTSDRGMAGAYSVNVLRTGDELTTLLRERGVEPVHYICGRKGQAFYRFRKRPVEAEWTGFSDAPTFENAREVGERLVADFLKGSAEGGVDEIHVVFTWFRTMVTQEPSVVRMLPIEVVPPVEVPAPEDLLPLYSFEPNGEEVLDALLPRYFYSRLFNLMLQAAASEHAARQRAMKSASDNAEELIRKYTRLANQARQAEITQEISEIVGGADALAAAGAD
ncbi:MAG: F0F1 ATP synthase subunit gamma [Actinomycetales bacterium]